MKSTKTNIINNKTSNSSKQHVAVGVVGGGVMGLGIVGLALLHEHPVVLIEAPLPRQQQSQLKQKILDELEKSFAKLISKGKITKAAVPKLLKRFTIGFHLKHLAKCNLVIEAVPELIKLKQEVLSKVEQVIASDALLVSNTSTLSITALASCLKCPPRLVGMHFFNPPVIMKLVEVVKGLQSDEGIVERVITQAKAWGKNVVVCSSSPGFIVNRVARPYYCEALSILDDGFREPEKIDHLISGSGVFPIGIFALMDLIGIDTNYRNTEGMYQAFYYDKKYKPSLSQLQYLEAGFWGRKTGRGFYDYTQTVKLEKTTNCKKDTNVNKGINLITIEVCGKDNNVLALGKKFSTASSSKKVKVVFNQSTDHSVLKIYLNDKIDKTIKKKSSKPQIVLGPSTGSLAVSNQNFSYFLQLDFMAEVNTVSVLGITNPNIYFDQKTSAKYREVISQLFGLIDKQVVYIPDLPGMVMERIVVCIINEALQVVSEGVASENDIDLAMSLGMNFKFPPLKLAKQIGYKKVYTILSNLYHITKNEKYRPTLELIRRKEHHDKFHRK